MRTCPPPSGDVLAALPQRAALFWRALRRIQERYRIVEFEPFCLRRALLDQHLSGQRMRQREIDLWLRLFARRGLLDWHCIGHRGEREVAIHVR